MRITYLKTNFDDHVIPGYEWFFLEVEYINWVMMKGMAREDDVVLESSMAVDDGAMF
ncbi:MAG: hypothetical protein MI717_03805 [Spirochaetales bacterium]|nr:hypothetical protein [Spirochaetales bacterium]